MKKGGTRGLGRIFARKGYWHVDISYGTIRIRRSTGVLVDERKSRSKAQDVLAGLLAEIREGRFGRSANKITPFNELVELIRADYVRRGLRSWDRVERALAHLRPVFGSLPAASITFARVSNYILRRVEQRAQPGTIRAEVAAVRRMLRLAAQSGLIASMPQFPAMQLSPARQGFLTAAQVEAVVANLPQPVADLVHALWITGWRRREVQFLKWSDVDMRAGEIRLTEGRSKTKVARVFPFRASPSLAAVVKARHDARTFGSVYVFERSPGKPVRDFRGAWENACEKAGVPGRVPHDLRRSRARVLSRTGVPQSVAMRLLGHKTSSMFLRYDVAATEDLAQAVTAAEPPLKGTRKAQEVTGGASAPEGESD